MIISSKPASSRMTKHAGRQAANDSTRENGARVGDDHVARIAISGQRMRNEPVISRITHRGIEEAIHKQESCLLVEFAFDGIAADWHLDDDIHLVRRIVSSRHRIKCPRIKVRVLALLCHGGNEELPLMGKMILAEQPLRDGNQAGLRGHHGELFKREGDPAAGFRAEALGCLAHDSASELGVEIDCALVLGQSPHYKAAITMLG